MANDASLVAGVGDIRDRLPGLNGMGDLLRSQMRYHGPASIQPRMALPP